MVRVLRIVGQLWLAFVLMLIAGGVVYAVMNRGPIVLLELLNPMDAQFWATWLVWGIALAPGLGILAWVRKKEREPPP